MMSPAPPCVVRVPLLMGVVAMRVVGSLGMVNAHCGSDVALKSPELPGHPHTNVACGAALSLV
jgi:hypothetical protein